jgi:hypothetical protein
MERRLQHAASGVFAAGRGGELIISTMASDGCYRRRALELGEAVRVTIKLL